MNYSHKKYNGLNGIKSLRRDDFIATYQWQLHEFGEKSHKIITTIPLNEYYQIGLCCIDNKITIAEFIRQSIRANIKDIHKMARKINKDTIHEKQGKLF